MFFFRDELEKQAILTPASALKATNYAKPGIVGDMIRGAGRAGFKVQQAALDATPAIQSIASSAPYGPAVALGTLKGEVARAAFKRVPMSPKVRPQVREGLADVMTYDGRNNPTPFSLNRYDLSNYIPTPSF